MFVCACVCVAELNGEQRGYQKSDPGGDHRHNLPAN